MPKLMPRCTSPASSSSLEESVGGGGALRELDCDLDIVLVLEARVGVDEVSLEDDAPVATLGEDFAAGEKFIFV